MKDKKEEQTGGGHVDGQRKERNEQVGRETPKEMKDHSYLNLSSKQCTLGF